MTTIAGVVDCPICGEPVDAEASVDVRQSESGITPQNPVPTRLTLTAEITGLSFSHDCRSKVKRGAA